VTSLEPRSVAATSVYDALRPRVDRQQIEITTSDNVAWLPPLELRTAQVLVLRAADGQRPKMPALDVLATGGRLELDGLLLPEPVIIEGHLDDLVIRHSTLVPGRALLLVNGSVARITVEHSILGPVVVEDWERGT